MLRIFRKRRKRERKIKYHSDREDGLLSRGIGTLFFGGWAIFFLKILVLLEDTPAPTSDV